MSEPAESFDDIYDRMVEDCGMDPMEVLFDHLDHENPKISGSAARELLAFRFPKKKAMEVKADHSLVIQIEDYSTPTPTIQDNSNPVLGDTLVSAVIEDVDPLS